MSHMDRIHRQQALRSEYWEYFGDASVHTEGKFLFFAKRRSVLVRIAKEELKRDFHVAKVSKHARDGAFVLCLYAVCDERKWELYGRYAGEPNVAYRFWKSNADTLAGKYRTPLYDERSDELADEIDEGHFGCAAWDPDIF